MMRACTMRQRCAANAPGLVAGARLSTAVILLAGCVAPVTKNASAPDQADPEVASAIQSEVRMARADLANGATRFVIAYNDDSNMINASGDFVARSSTQGR